MEKDYNYRVEYDFETYQILKEYCKEGCLSVVVELEYDSETVHSLCLTSITEFYKDGSIAGEVMGGGSRPGDSVLVYANGAALVDWVSMMGTHLVELGKAYLEWKK